MYSFVFGRAEVVERAVEAAHVVPALDVIEDGAAKSGPRRPCPSVDELALDGGEKRFGYCVVPALALASDREHDAVGPGQLGKVTARVLTAPVRMEDEPWCAVAKAMEGVGDELGPHVLGQGKADDPSALQVDDRGQIDPALPGADVGDVADQAVSTSAPGPKTRPIRSMARLAIGSAMVVLSRRLARPARPPRRMRRATRSSHPMPSSASWW